jgi:hypothetical protein
MEIALAEERLDFVESAEVELLLSDPLWEARRR